MMPHFPMDTGVPDNQIKSTIAVWAITPNGLDIAATLKEHPDITRCFISKKLAKNDSDCAEVIYFESLSEALKRQFHRHSGHIFIFSTGIAVRMIAPLLTSKTSDPAVVVVDDKARHVISLLSGHLGGANELTRSVAALLKSRPVITTATDVNDVPSIDMIAKKLSFYIETPQNIKHINMAFLKQDRVHVQDPQDLLIPAIPASCVSADDTGDRDLNDIFCSYMVKPVSRETLVLRPPVLCVGIGCNRGTSCEDIHTFLLEVIQSENLSLASVTAFGTTDLKIDEAGMTQLSEKMGIPMAYYTKEQLNSVKTVKNPSKMAQKHIGVKSVCEAAAILTANNGKLIVPKKKNKDVTIAVAVIQ